MPKKESRLHFTEEERMNPELKKVVEKAEAAAAKADKAQGRIPTKKKVKSELKADPVTGKMKVSLRFEDVKAAPPSRAHAAAKEVPKAAIRGELKREIREHEDENVGVEAEQKLEDIAVQSKYLLQEGRRSEKLKPYRDAAKAEGQLEKANSQYYQKKAEVEASGTKTSSKTQQKRTIKRQYAAAKSGKATENTKNAAKSVSHATKKATEKVEKAAQWVWGHKKGIAIIAGIMLLLCVMLSWISSCTVIFEGVGGAMVRSSYHASDEAMFAAEAAYCDMEEDLQNQLDNYEENPEYDEYHYVLDEIKHDPYVLLSILSALHPGEWTLSEVEDTMGMLFEKQYILTERVETETRYKTEIRIVERPVRDPETGAFILDADGQLVTKKYEQEVKVPYTYYHCYVELDNFNLSHVPIHIMGEERLSMYATYIACLGNRPDLFPNADFAIKRKNGYTDYDIPPELLQDERFAAIIAEAEKYLGYPYVWGGWKPNTSFDCSGFVSWVLNHTYWDVGHLSAQGLCNICTPVSKANVKPGDLVFFKGTYDTPGVSHVGIYVGNDMMLHCGDPISYTSLNTDYMQSHFYTYGRLPKGE